MSRIREESLEIARYRRLLEREAKARRKAEAALARALRKRAQPALPTEGRDQLDLPFRSRFPLSEFAEGRGKNIALPGVVEEMAQSIGRGNAVRLAEYAPQTGSRKCRRMLYIPQKMPVTHPVVNVIGLNAAQILSYSHGNEILEIPSCYALRRAYLYTVACQLKGHGVSQRRIATEMGLHSKTVEQLLAESEYWEARLVR